MGFQWKRYVHIFHKCCWYLACHCKYFLTIIRRLEEPLDIRNQAVHPSLFSFQCSLLRYQRPCRKASFSVGRNVIGEKVTVLFIVSQSWRNCTYKEEMAALNGGRSDVGVCFGTRPVGSVTDLGYTWCFKPSWSEWGRGLRLCLTWVLLWGGEWTPAGSPSGSPCQCLEVLSICLFPVLLVPPICLVHFWIFSFFCTVLTKLNK